MTITPIDRAAVRLVQEAADQAPVAPEWSEILARVDVGTDVARTVRGRRSCVALAAALSMVLTVSLGALVYYRAAWGDGDDAVDRALPVSSGTPSATPVPTTVFEPSRPIGENPWASCVATYSMTDLAQRGFAFDGLVTAIDTDSLASSALTLRVTFSVQEWFAGGSSPVVVARVPAPRLTSVGSPDYEVGSRLLITGGDAGTPSPEPLLAWACGFSRTYDARTAEQWRAAFAAETAPGPTTNVASPAAGAVDGVEGLLAPSAVHLVATALTIVW